MNLLLTLYYRRKSLFALLRAESFILITERPDSKAEDGVEGSLRSNLDNETHVAKAIGRILEKMNEPEPDLEKRRNA